MSRTLKAQEERFAQYRREVRETMKAMSDEALRFQARHVIGGIDREELEREMRARRIT